MHFTSANIPLANDSKSGLFEMNNTDISLAKPIAKKLKIHKLQISGMNAPAAI